MKAAFNAAADIYIVPAGVVPGQTLDDASGGLPNTVFGFSGGFFMDELIAFTAPDGNLPAGRYAVVYDECQNGKFDGLDKAFDPALEVVIPADLPPLPASPFADIKAKARAEQEFWTSTRYAYQAAFLADTLWGLKPGPRSAFSVFKMMMKKTTGFFTGVDPKALALKAAMDLANRQGAIADDPPDPDFARITSLLPVPVIEPDSQGTLRVAALALGEAAAAEDSLSEALLRSLERYQGADASGDLTWGLVHARAVRDYARALARQLAVSDGALADVDAAVAADTRSLEEDMAAYETFRLRVASSGFTADEIQQARDAGLDQAAINALRAEVVAEDFRFSVTGLRDGLRLCGTVAEHSPRASTPLPPPWVRSSTPSQPILERPTGSLKPGGRPVPGRRGCSDNPRRPWLYQSNRDCVLPMGPRRRWRLRRCRWTDAYGRVRTSLQRCRRGAGHQRGWRVRTCVRAGHRI